MKKTITFFTLLFTIFIFNSSMLNAQNYFEDDFETGLSKWIAGGNNWDTTSSTFTSSNHCITDSPFGNYTYNSDPTITLSQIINLSNSTQPVLAFYHKFNLAAYNCGSGTTYDYCYLEISTNGGFNWNQLKYWNGSNLAWTHEQFDLSAYKSNIVKIRFRLSSHNCHSNVADGWYVDEVKILESNTLNPTYSLPFTENFENGLDKWFVGGFNWDTTSISPSSGLYCATDSRTGNYTYNSDPAITMSGVVNLSGTNLPVLTFFHRYNLRAYNCGSGTTYDRVYLEISTNGGNSWIQIQSWINTNLTWTFEQFDLSNYKYSKVKIRYRISSHNCIGSTLDGAYLDDVSILDLSPSAINLELTALTEGLYDPVSNKMVREEKVKVYLREIIQPYNLVDTVVGYLNLQGVSGLLSFNGVPTGTYYIVIKNINGIETWSQDGGEFMIGDNSTYEYDFTTAASKAYGNNQILKGSKYCIYSGDVDQNFLIDLTDVIQIRAAAILFTTGYVVTDLNGDFMTDLTDVVLANNNSAKFVERKTPPGLVAVINP
ncbi:MAG: hypothetical protein KDD00_14045 [Ignavibacteriae bacterium]|nr:hypothetical protein [Ignavibacteriota bacterium]